MRGVRSGVAQVQQIFGYETTDAHIAPTVADTSGGSVLPETCGGSSRLNHLPSGAVPDIQLLVGRVEGQQAGLGGGEAGDVQGVEPGWQKALVRGIQIQDRIGVRASGADAHLAVQDGHTKGKCKQE